MTEAALYNEIDGYIAKGTPQAMQELKKLYEDDDQQNGVNIGKYWIQEYK